MSSDKTVSPESVASFRQFLDRNQRKAHGTPPETGGEHSGGHNTSVGTVALALGALGVVYGDIGTSPLYAMRECFFGSHSVDATPDNVLGVLSLIVYSLLLVISIKYIAIVMRADNQGEGGILATMRHLDNAGIARATAEGIREIYLVSENPDAYPADSIAPGTHLRHRDELDAVQRELRDYDGVSLGEAVVVENKPGAAQRASMAELLKSPADGRTLLYGSSALYCIIPHIYGAETGFDPFKDVTPLSRVSSVPVGIGAGLHIKAGTIAEFLAWAKANPSAVSYASPGAGTSSHFTGILLSQALGVPMTHVPYRGTAPAIADLIGGHVATGFVEAGASIPLIKDGKLRALAVSASQRLPLLPDVPPFSEAAGAPDYEAVSWHILVAPAKTPQPIVEKVHNEMKRIMADPEMKAKVANIGLIPIDTPSVADMRTYIASENEKWGSLVKSLGLQGSQ